MNQLDDDPKTLSFMLQCLETSNDYDIPTNSSSSPAYDSDQLTVPSTHSDTPPAPLKTRNRRYRKDEIERLRQQVDQLETSLDSLQAEQKLKVVDGGETADWRHQARCELRMRRRAELRNLWLESRLSHYKTTTERLCRRLAISTDRITQSLKPWVPIDSDSSCPSVSFQIREAALPGVTQINFETTWRFHDETAARVETAMRAMVDADRMATTRFSLDCKIIISDMSSSHGTFTIHSDDGFRLEGAQIARFTRDPTTGGFAIVVLAQTVPVDTNMDEIFGGPLLLDEMTIIHICPSSDGSTEVKIERRCDLHSTGTTHADRTELARAVAVYVKDEMKWMHRDVQRRVRLARDSELNCRAELD